MKQRTRQACWAFGLLSPALALFTVFIGLPMVLAFVIAFKRIDLAAGIMESPWVGFQNFRDLFGNVIMKERIADAFRNTLLFTVCFVPLNLLFALILASMIHGLGARWQNFYRAAFYLPTVASAIIFSMIWKYLYDYNYGLLNVILKWFGVGAINWTGDTRWAMWAVIIAALGAGPGGSVLIFLAALSSVPDDSKEAATIDGANALQRWWHVTLPALRPVILYLVVLTTIGSFQVFELVFILTSGGPASASTVIVYEIYHLAFTQGRYGVAGALSLILLLIVAVFAFVQFRLFRGDGEGRPSGKRLAGAAGEWIGDGVSRLFGAVGDWFERLGRSFKRTKPSAPLASKRPASPLARRIRRAGRTAPLHSVLMPLALLFLFPMIWMFLSALTPRQYLQTSPPDIRLSRLGFSNYRYLIEQTVSAGLRAEHPEPGLWWLLRRSEIVRWFWNSSYLAFVCTTLQVLLSCLAGYVFARLWFPGRRWVFSLFIASIMLPFQALIIPLFIVISSGIRNVLHIDLLNTHWAIILPGLCSPVGIFLMRQYIEGLPRELEEAARIDGAGELGIWSHVIVPLCKPIMGAWGILTFTGVWKSFFWPFVVLGSSQLFTLEVGLQTLQQQNTTDFGLVMAGATVSAVPMILIFFIFQKQIVKGLTFGAVKG
ncbi:MAG: hypothetical protein Kow0059_02950 [Candidatus Sumerlaeia bacterium]